MEELFSCRNCVNNCAQSVNIGRGPGFCLQHNSVITSPEKTTCKYLHRKDLPQFVVNEGISEHAAEFAAFSDLVSLETKTPIQKLKYSERFAWESHNFDPLNHALAQYHKSDPAWVFIQSFSGGLDGRRSLAHAALIRRYMNHCGTWTSSYRLILASLQEIDCKPYFSGDGLREALDLEAARQEALWDVVYSRLSSLQEYGFHAGLEEILWASDSLNGSLVEQDWDGLAKQLHEKRSVWTDLIIKHAKVEEAFFPPTDASGEDFR